MSSESVARSRLADEVAASADPRALLAGQTIQHFDPFHGMQLEYYHPDGTAYLWYPGHKISVRSEWEFRGERTNEADNRLLCYKYGPRVYNPVMKVRGRDWECQSIQMAPRFIEGRVRGDVFNLASGRVPWVLIGRPHRTLAEILRLHRSWFRLGRRY